MIDRALHSRPAGRLHWAMLVFLPGFAILLLMVGYFYLRPGVEALQGEAATPDQKDKLRAYSALLLAVFLSVLLLMGLVIFRVKQFFFTDRPRSKTDYPDAYAESARRVQVTDEDQEEDLG